MNETENLPPSNGLASFHVMMAPPDGDEKTRLKVACAWCGEVIEEGPGPVSHGMCANCRAAFLETVPGA